MQAKLEHHLIPQIYSRVQEHVSRPEDDAKLARFGKNLAFLSQSQYGIKPECQDISLSPYYAAISALKASSMCLLPTRKIFQIVRAAKLVFENLNETAAQDSRSPPGAGEVGTLLDVATQPRSWAGHFRQGISEVGF